MACSYADSPSESPQGVEDRRCPEQWAVIKVSQGLPKLVTVTLDTAELDDVGDYVDGELDESSANPDGEIVRLFFREHYGVGEPRVVGGVRTGAREFQFNFNSSDTTDGGMFVGEVVVFDKSTGGTLSVPTHADVPDPSDVDDDAEYRPVFISRVFVEVADSSFAPNTRSPVTIAEVRLWLQDHCPSANFLLDDYEFTDKEIFQKLQSVVDYWNEIPPPVATFQPSTFPYRYHHILGCVAQLLRSKGRVKLRNWLPYSAAGVSVQDQSIWAEYHKIGDQYWAEYQSFVLSKKVELNIKGGYRQSPGRFTGGSGGTLYRGA